MDSETLLLRQVHPAFIQADKISHQVFMITSQVFTPSKKDEKKLSVYNGKFYTASEAYNHYTEQMGYTSIGVVAINVSECQINKLDVIDDNIPFEGHCSIDFTAFTDNEIKNKAKDLKELAMKRGWMHNISL